MTGLHCSGLWGNEHTHIAYALPVLELMPDLWIRAPCGHVGVADNPGLLVGAGAEDVDGGVLGVEDGVSKGAVLYEATTNPRTAAICGE